MTPERLAEIEMVLTKRFDLLHPTWLYAACIELAAALAACERLRAVAEADADRWKAVGQRYMDHFVKNHGSACGECSKIFAAFVTAHVAAVALRPPVTP